MNLYGEVNIVCLKMNHVNVKSAPMKKRKRIKPGEIKYEKVEPIKKNYEQEEQKERIKDNV